MSDSPVVAAGTSQDSTSSSLMETQLTAFWDGIIANGEAARRMAGQFVPPHDAEDVVNSAAILFIESFGREKNPAPFPKSDDEFRRRFLVIVRNHAIDCVRDSDAQDRPVHSHWGVEPEPMVHGRKIGDRPLDHVFARNDRENYDAPAAAQARPQDDVDQLDHILRQRVGRLPSRQRVVIVETFHRGSKRAEVAARHGISVKTYDNHLQAAFSGLRDDLWVDAHMAIEVDRSSWYDRIEELSDRYDDALGRRLERDLEKALELEARASTPEGEADKSSGAGAA